MTEILASTQDVNANLDGQVVIADDENTRLIQVSVARVVRGYLARTVDNTTLVSWNTPAATPEIIREAAAKLIAAQLFINKQTSTTIDIEQRNYAQVLYDRAMELLNGVISGVLGLPEVPGAIPVESMSLEDFFPVDATDRAFTLNLPL